MVPHSPRSRPRLTIPLPPTWVRVSGSCFRVSCFGFRGQGSYMKTELNQSLSNNEVYYTNSLMSLVKHMLCSKLHCQKVLIQSPFHMRWCKHGHDNAQFGMGINPNGKQLELASCYLLCTPLLRTGSSLNTLRRRRTVYLYWNFLFLIMMSADVIGQSQKAPQA